MSEHDEHKHHHRDKNRIFETAFIASEIAIILLYAFCTDFKASGLLAKNTDDAAI